MGSILPECPDVCGLARRCWLVDRVTTRVLWPHSRQAPGRRTATSAATDAGANASSSTPALMPSSGVRSVVEEHGLTPAGVLLTHGHIDHVASAAEVADQCGRARLDPRRRPANC